MYKKFTPEEIKELEAAYYALTNNITDIAQAIGIPSFRISEYESLEHLHKKMKEFILSLSKGSVMVSEITGTLGYSRFEKRIPVQGIVLIADSDPNYELYWCQGTNDIHLENKKSHDSFGYAVRNGLYTEGEAYKQENDPRMLSYKIQDDFTSA